ncbi:helix-hairpin-helix domain-containing protein [Pedobacter sp. SD-b]|uniref:Helix-hairpin-helix domain-containing protein n=1 Tax=Pedobacter segetis TaxID=2793069 RepID=A0ABS1BLB8_9SPHI|nr:helix-hairpin-helix domain-containing protein [Pedobacter segetis]MBK0383019.1 helix-hairpin-helix domain-containing protein [Pedobacter segetis]
MSFKTKLFLLFSLLVFSKVSFAQTSDDPDIEYIIESIASNQTQDYDYSELIDRLTYYKRNKINLNKTSKEQLQELVFLNPLQIDALLNHIAVNGKLINVLELQSIKGFDLETIKNLLRFADINTPSGFENFSFNKLFKDGRNDLLVRYSRYLEQQQGFSPAKSTSTSRYLGTPERVFTRYRFAYSNNIEFSLNLEKDPGEKYLNGNYGPDFSSASLYIKDLGKVKKLVIGDYSLQFGQGLTLWSGLSFGKGADIFTVAKQDIGLKNYTSINEFSFFRGVATQINFGKFDFTPFVSYNKIDAGLALNPLTNLEEISSLQQSGLHRTSSELKNRRRISQLVFGGNLQYNYKKLSIGLTGYHSNYSQDFAPGNSVYNQFDFTGNSLNNVGINYSYTLNNTYFFGEFAHSLNSGIAYINGLISSLSPTVSAVLFNRNYQKDYYSFYNQGIGESSTAVNEKGFYAGLQIKPDRQFELDFYSDLFKFPYLKFGVDAPSQGYDIFSQFSFTPNKTTRLTLRYQFQNKQQNDTQPTYTNVLAFAKKSNYRADLLYQVNKSFSLRNRIEIVQYHEENKANRYGFLAYQDVIYSPLSSRWSGNTRLALFDTDGFDTRIYAYENDVLYGFSIPGFQNRGVRYYLNARYNVKRGVDLWMKYSLTKFNDQQTVGSGLDQIQGDLRSELKLQLRLQF